MKASHFSKEKIAEGLAEGLSAMAEWLGTFRSMKTSITFDEGQTFTFGFLSYLRRCRVQ